MIVTDLEQSPEHFDTVADRIWRAWWEPGGTPLTVLSGMLAEVTEAADFPFTLIATLDGRFLGTVTAIASDIAERPNLGPCVAALWVEPEARGQGIAQELVEAALDRLALLGYSSIYLAAKPHLHDYYAARGWLLVESEVGDAHLHVFVRTRGLR